MNAVVFAKLLEKGPDELISHLLTVEMMKADFTEWRDNKTTAIDIRIPVPAVVIKGFESFREKMKTGPPEIRAIDFNDMLARFFLNLTIKGFISKLKTSDIFQLLKEAAVKDHNQE